MASYQLIFCSRNENAKSFAQGSNENPRLLRGADSHREHPTLSGRDEVAPSQSAAY